VSELDPIAAGCVAAAGMVWLVYAIARDSIRLTKKARELDDLLNRRNP